MFAQKLFSHFLFIVGILVLVSCTEPAKPWRILVVAAEQDELNCAKRAYSGLSRIQKNRIQVDFLVTGIGINHSSYALTRQIVKNRGKAYDLILDLGIAGSYDIRKYPIGAVLFINREYFADLGFQIGDNFRDLFDYKLWESEVYPFSNGGIERLPSKFTELETWVNSHEITNGATVQLVSGRTERAEKICKHYPVASESMEGATIYYIAKMENIPCIEIRSISNAVAETNHSKWDIPCALNQLKLAIDTTFSKISAQIPARKTQN